MTSLPWAPCPNTVQLEAVYTTPGGIAENVFHVKGTGPYTDINALSNRLIDAYVAWENTQAKATRSNKHALTVVRVRDIGMQSGPVVSRIVNIVGTNGLGNTPDNVSIPIKWQTARSGRSFRGRTFFIGCVSAMLIDDTINPVTATGLVGIYNALITSLNGAGWLTNGDSAGRMVLVRRQYQKQPLNPAQTQDILSATIASQFVATRRTRLLGRHLKR